MTSPPRAPAGRPSRPDLGRAAEERAAQLMEARGAHVLFRNWRRPQGELDLVAVEGDTCVFVEVRSRTGVQSGHPLETVTAAKRAQVVRAARLFLAEEAVPVGNFRFDVVAVTFDAGGDIAECLHVPAAFTTTD